MRCQFTEHQRHRHRRQWHTDASVYTDHRALDHWCFQRFSDQRCRDYRCALRASVGDKSVSALSIYADTAHPKVKIYFKAYIGKNIECRIINKRTTLDITLHVLK